MTRHEFRFSGFGGQGVITMAHVVGRAATIHADLDATMTEAYGPEKTGGFSRGDVVVSDDTIDYPAVALVCSGGHTALYRCEDPTELELLGSTIDDAAGEAFDKVASILGLGYPGGPAVDKAARDGDPAAVEFPRSLLKGQSLDFSFSGLKTAVLYHVNGIPGGRRRPAEPNPKAPNAERGIENFTEREVADTAASFQAAVVDVLRIKLRRAAKATGARTLILGGGVSANSALRTAATELADKLGCTLRLPELTYCGDNGAMIAGLAHPYLAAGRTDGLDLAAHATVRR